jgi:hypothetical protein
MSVGEIYACIFTIMADKAFSITNTRVIEVLTCSCIVCRVLLPILSAMLSAIVSSSSFVWRLRVGRV